MAVLNPPTFIGDGSLGTPTLDPVMPGTVSNAFPAGELGEPITIAMKTRGTLSINPIDQLAEEVVVPPSFHRWHFPDKMLPSVMVDLPIPAFVAGRPVLPKYHAMYPSAMTITEGSGHLRKVPDPDPDIPGNDPPPVKGGFNDGGGHARWTVNDLPNPSGFSGGFYWLGTPSSADGTSGITSAARQWAPNSHSTMSGMPSWESRYPFKPSVRSHVWYGPNGNVETITKAVRFNTEYIEHMWLDMGSGSVNTPPCTWLLAGLIMHFDSPHHVNPIMDSGTDPGVNWGAGDCWRTKHVTADPDNYRFAWTASHTRVGMRTHASDSQTLYTPMHHDYKPKMFFNVINGANSLSGTWAPTGHFAKRGTLATSSSHLRHLVLGRKNGILSRAYASHMVVFEIRMWNRALDHDDLHEQYKQLSSTWKFHRYY
jgi:hypothetical protein